MHAPNAGTLRRSWPVIARPAVCRSHNSTARARPGHAEVLRVRDAISTAKEVATALARQDRNPYDYLTCHDRHTPRNATSPPYELDSAYAEKSASRSHGDITDRSRPFG